MLNVTKKRVENLDQVVKEGIKGLPFRKEPCFFPDLYSFRVLQHFIITLWSCNTLQNRALLALWLQNVAFLTVAQSAQLASFVAGRVKNRQHIAWLQTSQDSSFYVSFFLVSTEIFFVCFLECSDVMLTLHSALQLNPLSGYLERSTEFL